MASNKASLEFSKDRLHSHKASAFRICEKDGIIAGMQMQIGLPNLVKLEYEDIFQLNKIGAGADCSRLITFAVPVNMRITEFEIRYTEPKREVSYIKIHFENESGEISNVEAGLTQLRVTD